MKVRSAAGGHKIVEETMCNEGDEAHIPGEILIHLLEFPTLGFISSFSWINKMNSLPIGLRSPSAPIKMSTLP